MSTAPETTGPDLALGVAADMLADGQMLAGRIGDDAVLLAVASIYRDMDSLIAEVAMEREPLPNWCTRCAELP